MTKKIISILIPLLVSCSTLNQNAHSSLKEVCIDLLSVRVTIDMPVPIRFYRENYEEGIIYTYIFHDGIVFLHEGALMQFDIDSYIPSDSVLTRKPILSSLLRNSSAALCPLYCVITMLLT